MTTKSHATLFIISAPSGCGKTTIVNRILKTVPCVKRSVSVTTRRPRRGEQAKRDYHFLSEQAFKNKVKKGALLEWANNFGYYYGTPKQPVMARLRAGNDVILTIDVKGAAQVRKKMPGCIMIFIVPRRLKDLKKRLKKRATDTKRDVARRLAIAKQETAYAKRYDYIVVNDRLQDAVDNVKAIITAKRCEASKIKQC